MTAFSLVSMVYSECRYSFGDCHNTQPCRNRPAITPASVVVDWRAMCRFSGYLAPKLNVWCKTVPGVENGIRPYHLPSSSNIYYKCFIFN